MFNCEFKKAEENDQGIIGTLIFPNRFYISPSGARVDCTEDSIVVYDNGKTFFRGWRRLPSGESEDECQRRIHLCQNYPDGPANSYELAHIIPPSSSADEFRELKKQ